tara:strand:- start:3133 stop:3735 length:603 start_codon:yes stop_codon:yes gene_type:complete
MLQNSYKFNQSSVSLEIIGLPDYSKNDDEKSISIISQWKLSILNRPDIEGSADHLKNIIKAFYEYSTSLLLDQEMYLENKLIDIKPNKDGSHTIVLKSSKSEIKPLKIVLGNAEFSDLINCIDQLKYSKNIRLNFEDLNPLITSKKSKYQKNNIFIDKLIPPLFAIFSITILSLLSINFYDPNINSEDKVSFDSNIINWH